MCFSARNLPPTQQNKCIHLYLSSSTHIYAFVPTSKIQSNLLAVIHSFIQSSIHPFSQSTGGQSSFCKAFIDEPTRDSSFSAEMAASQLSAIFIYLLSSSFFASDGWRQKTRQSALHSIALLLVTLDINYLLL